MNITNRANYIPDKWKSGVLEIVNGHPALGGLTETWESGAEGHHAALDVFCMDVLIERHTIYREVVLDHDGGEGTMG
ncbi:MAG: hypothetical protein M1816_004535 [Peltula sp. TS41687]|nr:MAG: hypothetical protein M1816_004535 [Peltula sp. TS41687]